MSKTELIALATLAAFALPTLAPAQKKADPPKTGQKTEQKQAEPEKTDEQKAADKKGEEYEKAVKDLQKIDGAFTFYLRKRELLIELPEERLGKLFLIQAAFGTGSSANGTQAGDPIGDTAIDTFRFEKHDDQIWLVRPNLAYRWSAEDPLGLASSRSFPEAILAGFRIEQQHPAKKLVLANVTQLFYGDVFRLNDLVNMGVGGQYVLDREKCEPASVKSFDKNSVVRMNLHFVSPRGAERNPLLALLGLSGTDQLADSRSIPISVSYNLWYRETSDYMPRLADPRVGYFTEDFYSVDRFLAIDRTQRYIMRFNLKKKDPDAAMSEPVKPIVWTIDPSVPEQYRDACKDGILRWNKAFEKLGYRNAIVVQDAPDDPDWDHADGRYNVFRWTMSPDAGYAVSLVRTDPFTGEILNASITFDANMLQFSQQEHQRLAVPASTAITRANAVLVRDPKRREPTDAFLWTDEQDQMRAEARQKLGQMGWKRLECSFAPGLRDSASFAWNALLPLPGVAISKEEYSKEFIRDVVSHEMGHCLGLRHNFEGSTGLSTGQLANDDLTNREGVSASVMDYVPVNVMAVLKGQGNFFSPTIGKYDEWAIEYGYGDVKAYSPEGERYGLERIASQSTQPGLGFMTDENADSWNPYVVRFDNAADPLNYSERQIEAAHRIRRYAIDKLPLADESYARRTNMILQSIVATFREGRYASRFIGGIVANRSFRSGQGTLAPVSPALQRQATRLLARECLHADAFALPDSVRNNLAIDNNLEESQDWIAPLRQLIGRQQMMLYAGAMSADTIDRITENQVKWGDKPGAYTLEEHVGTMLAAAFGEIGKNQNVPATRRDLQRFALNALILQSSAGTGAINEDMRLLASDALRRLSVRFGQQLAAGAKLDSMTRLHLKDCKETVDRFLERHYAVGR
ncbi:MAG: zinc-dependent metalloprotease [Chthonomonadaceae bacterium]|nr:zinc-dependent metalloprotease [Chthonomonadaceae bacterium]